MSLNGMQCLNEYLADDGVQGELVTSNTTEFMPPFCQQLQKTQKVGGSYVLAPVKTAVSERLLPHRP